MLPQRQETALKATTVPLEQTAQPRVGTMSMTQTPQCASSLEKLELVASVLQATTAQQALLCLYRALLAPLPISQASLYA